MKTITRLTVFAFFMGAFTAPAHAAINEPGRLGVGGILGDPMGFTAKYWLDGKTALDATAAWHFSDEQDRFEIHADYLYHMPIRTASLPASMLGYVGLGGRALTGNDPHGGLRIPFGISLFPSQRPLEFFAEIAPVIDFAPDTDATVNGGVGLRFYF